MKKKKMAEEAKNGDSVPKIQDDLKSVCENLVYMSESDAPVEPYCGDKAESVTPENVLAITGNPADAAVEVREVDDFFTYLTEMQDWFGDEEKKTAEKFIALQKILKEDLKDSKVFKIGKIQLDVYMVGLDSDGKLTGAKTKAVET